METLWQFNISLIPTTDLEIGYPEISFHGYSMISDMKPSWHGTHTASLALCEGNLRWPVTGDCPSQLASNAGFGVYFDISLHILLNKQSICDLRPQDAHLTSLYWSDSVPGERSHQRRPGDWSYFASILIAVGSYFVLRVPINIGLLAYCVRQSSVRGLEIVAGWIAKHDQYFGIRSLSQ